MDVLLLMDSMTRFAMAQREVGLSVGEPPATKGYTPSVFALMPRLLERAGATEKGSITGFYTVLVEGDDMADPVSDAARGLLDGHIVLSRRMASQNIYPSIDVLASKSRVMIEIVQPEHQQAAGEFTSLAAAYEESADLIQVGAYVRGSDARVDRAVELRPKILGYLRQGVREGITYEAAVTALQDDVLSAAAAAPGPPRPAAAPPRPAAPGARPAAPRRA
ncbi:MAG: hypothetical protein A3J27_15940 [Candidatus Tectomicrobia bacterium RIFCSPLOWO2_12_FULL_69_37]|nr:MAG: hypothetical protein A3J27_15940 [Candidatus Tectomicrobia bacterium RIFCSPLOWO2_12_FULL_69_37]